MGFLDTPCIHQCEVALLEAFVEWMFFQAAKYARTSSETGVSRRALGSSVGAVLKHDNNEDEEEYDPRRPAIGNVASVIKVTERRWDQLYSSPGSYTLDYNLYLKLRPLAEIGYTASDTS